MDGIQVVDHLVSTIFTFNGSVLGTDVVSLTGFSLVEYSGYRTIFDRWGRAGTCQW